MLLLQGAERTMDILYDHLNHLDSQQTKSIFFLTPCHQLPFYSFLHGIKIKMGFFDCSPQVRPINDDSTEPHLSWRQRFWDNPILILNEIFPSGLEDPSSIDFNGTSDVYIYQQQQHQASWFGGLYSSSESQIRISSYGHLSLCVCISLGTKSLSQSSINETSIIHQLLRKPSLKSIAECLDYRFEIPLRARELPTFFVVPSALLRLPTYDVTQWIRKHGYQLKDSIFDSFISEHPKSGEPPEFMSRLFIFQRSF